MKDARQSLLEMFDHAPIEAEQMIQEARRHANRRGESELVLAGALARLERHQGKAAFAENVEAELGVRYRKAMYLIAIHGHFAGLGIDERRLAAIGWSKAKELVGVATRENFAELADFAEAHKRTALIAHLAANYGRPASLAKAMARTGGRLSFALSRDQAEVVRQALDLAKAKLGSADDGEALAFICGSWVSV